MNREKLYDFSVMYMLLVGLSNVHLGKNFLFVVFTLSKTCTFIYFYFVRQTIKYISKEN